MSYVGRANPREFRHPAKVSVAKIRWDAVFEKICAIGRAIAIGIQGVINTARLQPGSRRPTILTRS